MGAAGPPTSGWGGWHWGGVLGSILVGFGDTGGTRGDTLDTPGSSRDTSSTHGCSLSANSETLSPGHPLSPPFVTVPMWAHVPK